MKLIPLTKGAFAIVDDSDFVRVGRFDWYLHSQGYAARDDSADGRRVCILMHREIMRAGADEEVDHRNLNRLDCRRGNLRRCTRLQNSGNQPPRTGSRRTSRFKGVHFAPHARRWRAFITIDYRTRHLGYFDAEVDAARVYDAAAAARFGEFAWLNFPAERKAS